MKRYSRWIWLALAAVILSACAEPAILPAPNERASGVVLSEPAPAPTEYEYEKTCTSGGDGIGGTGCPID